MTSTDEKSLFWEGFRAWKASELSSSLPSSTSLGGACEYASDDGDAMCCRPAGHAGLHVGAPLAGER